MDLSFATPSVARRVYGWRVMEEVETLSDHRYIRFAISASSGVAPISGRYRATFPRWSLCRLDRELAEEAAIVQSWRVPAPESEGIDAMAAHLRAALVLVCDASMPRSTQRPREGAVFWWSQELAELRVACFVARRRYVRSRRRRRRDLEEEARLYASYRNARKILQENISRAKDEAWGQLLESLERNPWGRPYQVARKKFRGRGPPVMETLQPAFLQRVVDNLFPNPPDFLPSVMCCSQTREEVLAPPTPVSNQEWEAVTKSLRGARKAPGPDGVPGQVLTLALHYMAAELRGLYDRCLASGQFPKPWKEGRLVLLAKEGRPPDCPSAYRPLVLLDDAGKMFERVVASRVVRHIEGLGPRMSDAQFGFRAGRSTIDAVRPVLREWCKRAFGSLTFRMVQVLTGHGCFGQYLHRIARREPSAVCHECGAGIDSAQHTLAECPSWEQQRRALAAVVGEELLLPNVVRAMVAREEAWVAMASFCEDVIAQKEAAERIREADPHGDPLRIRRRGERRARFICALPPP